MQVVVPIAKMARGRGACEIALKDAAIRTTFAGA